MDYLVKIYPMRVLLPVLWLYYVHIILLKAINILFKVKEMCIKNYRSYARNYDRVVDDSDN